MKKILVPTDFSKCAALATRTAIDIAKKIQGELVFLHYMSIPVDWVQLAETQAKIYPDVTHQVKQAQTKLDELVRQAERLGVRAYRQIAFNEGSDNIVTHISANRVDFIIMGSHGCKGLKEFFIGSNAQRVVRFADVPVLVVKKEPEEISKTTLIYLSDFEPDKISSFQQVASFAQLLGLRIRLLFVNTPEFFLDTWSINEKMKAFLELANAGKEMEAEVINSFDIESDLKRYCEEKNAGLIAMSTHGYTGVSRVLYGSLTEKIVNHIDLPVLSMKV